MATTTDPTATGVMSWEAFEQLPDDGMHREIIEGELITLPPPQLGHSEIARRVFRALDACNPSIVAAYFEAGFKLSETPPTWIQPDVSLVSAHRAGAPNSVGYLLGAPELAVEVISPSESANDVAIKIKLLFRHGARAIWVVWPDLKEVEVKRADGTSVTLGIGDLLTLADLVAGWELPVAKLFE